jgi:4-hydroxyphenylpyruvate dioxygenase
MAFRVVDAKQAYERALSLGAEPADIPAAQKALDVPAIRGIGGSLLYFVDRYGAKGAVYDAEFEWLGARDPRPEGAGLFYIDHLTHNVHRGRMDVWTGFYEKLFNFRQIRFFDIEGRASGLFSRALTSPDGKIRIPINEDAGAAGQIEEYLKVYRGEGIQHIACGVRDIYRTVETLRDAGLPFMPSPPDAYFEKIEARLPMHGEDVARLKRDGILIDGEGVVDGGHTKVLLQIFSANAIGPIFFEFIQRKGDDGFGEGNFKALFESIEEDQIRHSGVREARTRNLAPTTSSFRVRRFASPRNHGGGSIARPSTRSSIRRYPPWRARGSPRACARSAAPARVA